MIKTKAKIITIGNSKGVRIPKILLEQAQLPVQIELEVKKGAIIISADSVVEITDTAKLSESVLARDWNRPEEDAAWLTLQ